MKDKVFMSPNNGVLVIGVPLYRRHDLDIGSSPHVILTVEDDDPMAYMIDYDGDRCSLLNAEWVEENLECLGEL